MISFAEIPIARGVCVTCRSCGSAPSSATFVPAEQLLSRVREACAAWGADPGPNVAFVGGEPFAHPELPALVAGAVAAAAQRIRLRTDGGALAVDGNAPGAIAAGVRHIEVVLLGGDAVTHDRLSGRPGLFADAMEGLRAFSRAAADKGVTVAVGGLVPVCRHNLEHVPGAVSALAHAGATTVTLDVSEGAAASFGARAWVAAAIESGQVNGAWVTVRGMEAPVSALHAIDPAAGVAW